MQKNTYCFEKEKVLFLQQSCAGLVNVSAYVKSDACKGFIAVLPKSNSKGYEVRRTSFTHLIKFFFFNVISMRLLCRY